VGYRDLIDHAKHTLRKHIGATGSLIERAEAPRPSGSETIFLIGSSDAITHRVVVEAKRRVRTETIHQLRDRFDGWLGKQDGTAAVLLVTQYVGCELAKALESAGICFADSVGNAYLEVPGALRIHSVGHRPPPGEPSRGSWHTEQGAKVLFHLLSQGPQVRSTYREMSRRLRVSLSMISKVVVELMTDGIIVRQKRGAYDIVGGKRLLAMWLDTYATRLWERTLLGRFRAPFETDFIRLLRISADDPVLSQMAIGGEFAACRLAEPLRAERVSLHVPPEHSLYVRRTLALAPCESGPIELHDAFASPIGRVHVEGEPEIADAVLVLAELVRAGHRRYEKAIASLRERCLSWIG